MSNQETETHPDDQNNAQCMVNVHSVKVRYPGIWGNERKPITIRIDVELYKAFKKATRAFGSSVCSEVETLMLGYMGFYESAVKDNVHIGNTFNMVQTNYRNLGRERRKVNPAVVTERDVHDVEIGSLESLADPFITYYLNHPDLDPGPQKLYRDFVKDGLELDWEVKQGLASLILRRLKEFRVLSRLR